jgi:SAM-dependent methyltransferase
VHPLQRQEQEKRDREAHGYEAFFPAWRVEAEAAAVRSAIARGARRRDRVVDLGTGTGRVLRTVASDFGEAVGVDFSAESLRVASARLPDDLRAKVTWRQADATATGLEAGTADVVTCVQLLQHLPTEDLRDALVAEARRILRPGGLLVLTCYGFNVVHRLRGRRESVEGGLYVRRHSPSELRARLARAFADVAVRAIVGLPDALPMPRLDLWLSHAPGWSLFGRTLLGTGRREGDA